MTATRASDPEASDYYEQGFWERQDLWSDVSARMAEHPAKVAFRCGEQSITYSELERRALALSDRLAAASVGPGDVVALLGRHSLEAAVAIVACLHRGVVTAPVPPMFGAVQLASLMAQCDARALLCFGGEAEIEKCEGLADKVPLVLALRPQASEPGAGREPRGSHEPADPDALALLLHSSGTTSAPKGIMHSSNTVRYTAHALWERWSLTPRDVYLVVCEFGFVGSIFFGYFPTLLSGATAVLQPRWDPAAMFELVERNRCSYVLLMPTHTADLLDSRASERHDLASMRVWAAPGLTRERREQFRDVLGRSPLADYGLSEVPGNTTHEPTEAWEKVLRTEGLPLTGTEIRIVGPDGEVLGPEQEGSIEVNGPSRFLGFLGNEELTRVSIAPWGGYRTGDLGLLDADGHLVYLGRSKDIIRRGAVTIVPSEVEAALSRHPDVREVSVIALPDERLGERACAALLLAPGAAPLTLEDVQRFLASEGVSKYSWPERVELFDELPRTSSLKVVKRDLVRWVLERDLSVASAEEAL